MASSKKFGKGPTGSSHSMTLWLGIALLIFLLDQFTKVLVLGAFQLGDSTPITSFFNLVRVHNHGAAFSFLADAGGWQRWFFTGIGGVAAVFMLWMLYSHAGQKLFSLAGWPCAPLASSVYQYRSKQRAFHSFLSGRDIRL